MGIDNVRIAHPDADEILPTKMEITVRLNF